MVETLPINYASIMRDYTLAKVPSCHATNYSKSCIDAYRWNLVSVKSIGQLEGSNDDKESSTSSADL